MRLITLKAQFYIPDDVHEMDFKKRFICQLDFMGVIIDDVSIIQNELVPESMKKKILTPAASKKRFKKHFPNGFNPHN